MRILEHITLTFFICANCLWGAISGVAVDITVFRGPAGTTGGFAEVVWSVNRSTLAFGRADDSWRDTLEIQLVFEKDDEPVETANLIRIIELPQGSMITESYLLFDKYGVQLPSGNYDLTINFRDLGDSDTFSVTKDFVVPPRSENMWLSGFALLSDVSLDTSGGLFTYGNYKMLPNPARIFGISAPLIYAYVEVYRPDNAGTLLVKTIGILTEDSTLYRSYPAETTVVKLDDSYILNGINVMGLPDGNYILKLAVEDPKLDEEIWTSRSFTVSKSVQLASSEVASETIGDLEQEYKYATYFLMTSERALFEKLSDNGKREYLARWWEEHDTTPDTPQNEYREEIVKRWHYANAVFDQSGTNEPSGWLTDRGRVYIIYGPPDDIERNPITSESNPWEQWEYFTLQGGVIFIFADVLGIGDYRLLHSTAQGELYDPNWNDKLIRRHIPTGGTE